MASLNSSSQGNNGKVEQDFRKKLRFYRALVQGKWDEVEAFLKQQHNLQQAIQAPLDCNLDTALHVTATAGDAAFFAEKLVAKLPDEALGIKNRDGLTPLHLAARFGNREVAEILVGRDYSLLYHTCNNGLFPIHYAACNTGKSKEVYGYFYGVTKDDGLANPYAGPTGATLLVNLIKSQFYDMANELVDKYPDLTRHHTLDKETTPLDAIVKYDCSIINKTNLSLTYFWQLLKTIPKERKLKHDQAIKLLKCLCDKLEILNDDTQVASLVSKAIIRATYLDIGEVVQNIVEAYPTTAYYQDESNGQNILHIAVKNRCKNVLNFVCEYREQLMHDLVDERDKNDNNIVHLAGKLAPPDKLNLISGGAALQMQQELQWFQEVQKIALPYFKLLKNKDGKTPKMVFTEEHKDLKSEGEKWMKDTANSCIIAAALIVTVTFAAAITVPGGNNQQNGLPIFLVGGGDYNNTGVPCFLVGGNDPNKNCRPIFFKEIHFKGFYYLNGASFFSSTISLLVFLSILTSRYAEEDFLCALPKRLIIGLLTLLVSIGCMMGSFSKAAYLLFADSPYIKNGQIQGGSHDNLEKRIVINVVLIVLSCVTAAAFVVFQFQLLISFLWYTYLRRLWGTFGNKRHIPQMPF